MSIQSSEQEADDTRSCGSLVGMTLSIQEEKEEGDTEVAGNGYGSNAEMTPAQLQQLLEEAEKQRALGRQQRQEGYQALLCDTIEVSSPLATAAAAAATATAVTSDEIMDNDDILQSDRKKDAKQPIGKSSAAISDSRYGSTESDRKPENFATFLHAAVAMGVIESIPGAHAVDHMDTSTTVTEFTDESSSNNTNVQNPFSRRALAVSMTDLEAAAASQTSGLAVAQIVGPEPDNARGLPVALEESQARHPKRNVNPRSEKNRGILAALLLVGVILGSAFLSVWARLRENTSPGDQTATHNSNSTSLRPALNMTSKLYELLPEATQTQISKRNTPQHQAFQWVLHDPALSLIGHPATTSRISDWRLQQRFALALLYFSMDGANWYNSTNWLSYQVDECSWWSNPSFGVITMPTLEKNSHWKTLPCDASSMRFQDLFLQNNRLAGSIPEELFILLPSLRRVGLYSNSLQGTIPSEVGLASNLQVLALNRNDFGGTIPMELVNLSHLFYLGLASNSLEGHLPTKWPKMLAVAQLEENRFSGSIPSQTGELSQIKELSLNSNRLSSHIPSELGQAASLMRLHLNNNIFTGSLPSELGRLTMLQSFLVQGNPLLRGALPEELGALACRICTISSSADWVNDFRPPKIQAKHSGVNERGATRFRRLGLSNNDGSAAMRIMNISDTLISGQVPMPLCDILDPTSFDCSDILCGCNCTCG